MRTLLISHSSISHLNAFRRISCYLAKRHEFLLVTNKCEYFPVNSEINVRFTNSMPFGRGFESILLKGRKYSYFEELRLRANNILYRERSRDLGLILSDFKPQLVLLDLLYSTDLVILYKWLKVNNSRIFLLSTKPSIVRRSDNVPISSSIVPTSSRACIRAWRAYEIRQRLKHLWNYIKFFGTDDRQIILKYMKRNSVPIDKYRPRFFDSSGVTFQNVEIIYCLPREFEFSYTRSSINDIYIGFQVAHAKERITFSNDASSNPAVRAAFYGRKQGKTIIYCSMGTLYAYNLRRFSKFIHILLRSAEGLGNSLIIFSCRRNIFKLFRNTAPNNMQVFDMTPQMNLLQYTDVFVNHGGINSIKEGIFSSVPMLIIPLNLKMDQVGNAARVAELGIGIKCNITHLTSTRFLNYIKKLTTEKSYKLNINSFKNYTDYYSEYYFWSNIDHLLSKSIDIK